MNIAISCLTLQLDNIGGLQYRLKNLIEGFCERGHTVKIVQSPFAYKGSRLFYEKVEEYKVEPIIIPHNINKKIKPMDLLRMYNYKVFDILDKYHIDILDTYDPYIRIPKKHIPMIYSTNYFLPYIYNQIYYGGFKNSFFHILKVICEQVTIINSDSIIVENKNQKNWLNKWMNISNTKINVILPGYDENMVHAVNKSGFNSNVNEETRIIFVGRITYLKGVFELLDAFNNVNKSSKNHKLFYVGDGPDKKKLETIAKKRGISENVKFIGERSQVETIKIINQSDIVVLPSYNEGVPLSIIESMALKKPIIASDVGGISAHLIEDLVNGILIKPKNVKQLEKALRLVCTDPEVRIKFGLNSWKKAKNLTNMKMVNDTLQVYEAVYRKSYKI
ncbi:MAG TPA: glycosyltransferase family 4 protein [Gallicola sp.]|jgi:glycosyltransferase involved in cell wall biosynthesis|nr:glycosyltransferase family 4 protein [Gallicola sp.]